MNIVILTQYYPPEIGAPQTRLAAIARELHVRGHAVEVVTAMPHHLLGRVYDGYRGKWYSREMLDGVPVHRTWVYAASGTGIRRMANYLSFTASSLFGLFRTRRPDLIFVESPPLFLSVPGWIAATLRRSKIAFNVADLWPDSVRELGVMGDGPIMRIAQWLEGWSYRRSHYVNAVTDGIEGVLRTQKGVPAEKILRLPNGIDTVAFAPRERDEELARELQLDDRRVFIYAGTHGIAQGLHNVIDAAALVRDRATMLFVGAGPTKAALERRAAELQLDNVRFVDPVPLSQMPRFFSLAYASIVPLVDTELMRGARPSKMFPAFSSGVPVLYSGSGEGASLVESAGAGIVVAPESASDIARGIVELCDAPERRDAMAVAARRFAVERFGWPSIVDAWLAGIETQPQVARAQEALT